MSGAGLGAAGVDAVEVAGGSREDAVARCLIVLQSCAMYVTLLRDLEALGVERDHAVVRGATVLFSDLREFGQQLGPDMDVLCAQLGVRVRVTPPNLTATAYVSAVYVSSPDGKVH
jgi:hypothetical protein